MLGYLLSSCKLNFGDPNKRLLVLLRGIYFMYIDHVYHIIIIDELTDLSKNITWIT